jgi:hypothetical protein
MAEENSKEKLWILVKAYPQPSTKYQETVCCAGITMDGRLLRLYPIRYRHLKKEQQFNRFDLLEVNIRKSTTEKDKRPESYRVDEDSIVILRKGKQASGVTGMIVSQLVKVQPLPCEKGKSRRKQGCPKKL